MKLIDVHDNRLFVFELTGTEARLIGCALDQYCEQLEAQESTACDQTAKWRISRLNSARALLGAFAEAVGNAAR